MLVYLPGHPVFYCSVQFTLDVHRKGSVNCTGHNYILMLDALDAQPSFNPIFNHFVDPHEQISVNSRAYHSCKHIQAELKSNLLMFLCKKFEQLF